MNEQEKIYFHGGGYNCLSNFAAYKVKYEGNIWMTAEHAYQAAKFQNGGIKDAIAAATSAHEAKQIAHDHDGYVRDDWLDVNVDVMKHILRAKLNQHNHIQEKLQSSKNRTLIEGTDDSFWGRGPDGNGENKLGKLWIQLRQEL
jgi:ribA/ribD-fused uncharacterized protein